MDQTPSVRTWLFRVAATKASWAVAKFLTAIISAAAVQGVLRKLGIAVDPAVFMPSVAVSLMAALEVAHDYAKLKTGWKFL